MPVVTDERALLSGSYWTGVEVENKPVFVTYSFQTAATGSHAGVLGATAAATFQALNAAQENSVRAALAEWGDASGITFLEVAPDEGAINFSAYDFAGSPLAGVGGYCEYPFGNWDYATASSTPGDYLFYDDAPFERGGDVLLDTAAGVNVYGTILHEIGHALGFKHPTEVVYNHEEVLSSDDPNLTIMSTVGGGTGHLTALDKAAAARVYGAAGSDGSHVASWSWNASTRTLTQTGFATADEIRGTNVSDVIDGMGGDDKIFGLGGSDVLNGGQGNDLIFDAANHPDTTAIDGGAGDDRIALYLVSAGFTGTIDGGGDNDRLVAHGDLSGLTISNVETFVGSYYGAATLTAAQLSGFGDLRHEQDEFSFAPSHALSLALAGAGTVDFSGKVAAAVNLTVEASAAGNTFTGHAGIDSFLGSTGSDVFRGGDGDDFLDGGGGADKMYGGKGDDTYIVSQSGDKAYEASGAGSGYDTVKSSVSYDLYGQYVEKLVLTGAAVIDATGNSLANVMEGNDSANRIDGGAGSDKMYGGNGDDIYIVSETGDKAYEASGAGSGFDTVMTSVNYDLYGQYVEKLVLTGTGAINAKGNSLANVIEGNSAANQIDGGAGIDKMYGGNGDDIYIVSQSGDKAYEASGAASGFDTVMTSVTYDLYGQYVEKLVLTGTGAINGKGNTLANVIEGNSGANRIDGGGGADSLRGNDANDIFVFTKGQANGDTVVDFAGNGAAAGDSLEFRGYNSGATFVQIDATHWALHDGGLTETLTIANGAAIAAGDYVFA